MAIIVEGRRRVLVLTTTILASGLGFLMNSAVNIALPTIQSAFDIDIQTIQWIANGYLLALSSLILLSGSLADILGTRRVYNTGILIFSGGALACGLAPSPGILIAARAIQGLGAALMIPGSLAIINETFPREERGRVIGLWAGVSGAIAALGPFVGGFLASFSWRWVFIAVVLPGVATYLISRFSVPPLREETRKRIDWSGAIVVVVALGTLSFGLIRLPETGASALTVSALAAGLLAIPLFVYVEHRQENPLVPFSLFTPLVAGANLATLLLYFSFQGIFFLLSFNLQQLQGLTPTRAGLGLLPATALIALLSAPSGTVTDRSGPRAQMIVGPLLVAIGVALLVILPGKKDSLYAVGFLPGIALVGLGMVTLIPAVTKSALEVPQKLSGTASGVNNAAARLAGLLAITIQGAVLNATYRAALRARLAAHLGPDASDAVLSRAGKLLEAEVPSGLDPALVQTAMNGAFLQAFRASLLIAAAAALSAALISTFLIHNPKPQER